MRRPGLPLGLAIALALVVKVILLTILYQLCFSAPQVKKMRMPTEKIEQHLLTPPPKVQP